jgi:hypothetical protein
MKRNYNLGTGENVANTQDVMTLSFAEGQVDPAVRVARGEINQGRVDELITRLQNREFIDYTDPESIPHDCMDCRGQVNGQAVVGVKAAGGSTTMVVADALTSDSYRQPGEKAPQHKKRLLSELLRRGKKVGGHSADEVASDDYAGCGAEDKLDGREPNQPSILGFIARKASTIFDVIRSLGQTVEPELEASIPAKAVSLQHEGYATTGKELSQAGVEVAGPESRKTLTGPQKGVVVAVLTQPGEILDQARINYEFGDDYEVFEIAAWAIANGARETSLDAEEEHAKYVAGLAYNLAAGGVIAGPGMPVVVL